MDDRRLRYGAGLESPRARVMSTWALVGVTALVLVLLAAIFPKDTLLQALRREARNDRLAASYMRSLLRTDPGNVDLRIQLASRQLELGELRDAEQTLAGLDRARLEPPSRRGALLLEAKIVRARITDWSLETGQAAGSEARLRAIVWGARDEAWSAGALLYLGREATRLGLPQVALGYYRRIVEGAGGEGEPAGADPGPDVSLSSLEAASAELLALGEYESAAQLLFAAQRRATDRPARRTYYLRALRVLQSGNLLGVALAEADRHIGDLAEDQATLVFLAGLARAANDQARAQDYVRRLLRLGVPSAAVRALGALLAALVGEAHAQEEGRPSASPAMPPDIRPYDATAYTLAWNVFLANGNLDEAYKLATAAVAQRPDDPVWRERLAQVCEWTGRSQEALAHWRYLADRTGSARALEGVLRLAPGLGEDEALLAAWQRIAARRALAPAEARLVGELFERVGRPEEGSAFFRERYARAGRREDLELVATLAERAGRNEEAIAAYEQLLTGEPIATQHVMALAMLHIARGDFQRAYAVLERTRGQAPAGDIEYWRLLGELAWTLERDEQAREAYARIEALGEADRFEIDRLARLLQPRYPAEAARLAEIGWRRLRDPSLLLIALEHYAAARDQAALARLFGEVTPDDERRLAAQPRFFVLRADYRAAAGHPRQGLADMERALAVRPDDTELRVTLLWFLIDWRLLPELRRAVERWRAESVANATLWPVYGVAYATLNEPRLAWEYFRRDVRNHTDDYLWLLNFADALEDDNRPDMAWRVRRHAWHVVRAKIARTPQELRAPDNLVGYARLVALNAPGDPSLAVVRYVLRQSRSDGGTPALTAAADELLVAWALSTEQNETAKGWLWARYARSLARSPYAEIAVALAHNDTETIERLVAGDLERLPRHNQNDAARALGWTTLARDRAFVALERYPADDESHLRLDTDARALAGGAIARQVWFEQGVVRGYNTFVAAPFWVGEPLPQVGVRLIPFFGWTHQSSDDQSVLTGVPGTDRTYGLTAYLRKPQRVAERPLEAEFTFGYRTGFAGHEFASAVLSAEVLARTTLTVFGGYQVAATDTSPLFVAGMKDELRFGLFHNLAKREWVSLGLTPYQRFATQSGAYIGSGARVDAEVGYRVRTEYPDLAAWLYAARQTYRPDGQPDAATAQLNPAGTVPGPEFFLPPDYTYYSLNLGFGLELQGQPRVWERFMPEPYSRAWRPFGAVGYGYSSVLGSGYNLMVGAGGSVLGTDYLSLYFSHSDGGTGSFVTVREAGLRYQLFF